MSQTPDQKLAAKYSDLYSACARARQPFEKEWYMNLAFFFGKQYVQWRSSANNTSAMVIPPAAAWRVRLVSNRIKPIIRKEIAKLNKERGEYFVIPPTPDDEDIAKARTAEAIAEHLLTSRPFHLRKGQGIWWASITGVGYVHTVYAKDINYEAPSPFHIWVPNLEDPDIQSQPYIIHGVGKTVDEVQSLYNVSLEPDTTSESPEQKFLQGMGLEKKQGELSTIFLKEFWVKPCREFPNGALFVLHKDKLVWMNEAPVEFEIDPTTQDQLVDPEGNPIEKTFIPSNQIGGDAPRSSFPYDHGRYPFTKIDHIPTGRYYGQSVIVDLIPLQKEYNKSRSQGIEARNLTAKPQWAVAKGSVDVKKLTSQPGLVIEYTPGFDKPEPVNNPDLPPYVMQLEAQTLNDIDYISNQFEVSQGRTPPGVEAASAIAYLQEESDSILQTTIDSIERAVEDIGFQSIELAKQYWDEGRMVQILSGNQVYEVMQFKQNSLPDQLDFRVEHGSMAPRSRAAKQAFILEAMDKGLIPPVEGMKYLEMSETSRLYNELQMDQRHAERENFKMKNGVAVQVNIFDNATAHIWSHGKFMKSQSYEALPDEIKALFLKHYQEHLVTYGKEVTDGRAAESGPESGRSESNSSAGNQPAG